jgi:preprotein translocase subunit SecB
MSVPEDPAAQGARQPRSLPITINAQYVKDLSFENPRGALSLQAVPEAPKIDVHVDVKAARLSDTVYEVAMSITANSTSAGEPMFLVELTYAGAFTIGEVPENVLHAVLLIECPKLLFPFARSVLANAVRDGGFPPLLLQPMDFAALYQQGRAQQGAAGQDSLASS